MSGYVPCACRDCMEIAIGETGEALCHECEAADCEPRAGECTAPGAYGGLGCWREKYGEQDCHCQDCEGSR